MASLDGRAARLERLAGDHRQCVVCRVAAGVSGPYRHVPGLPVRVIEEHADGHLVRVDGPETCPACGRALTTVTVCRETMVPRND